MAYLTEYQYYENTGNPNTEDANWGSYQYVSLYDINITRIQETLIQKMLIGVHINM